jgi:hypothetical protein
VIVSLAVVCDACCVTALTVVLLCVGVGPAGAREQVRAQAGDRDGALRPTV